MLLLYVLELHALRFDCKNFFVILCLIMLRHFCILIPTLLFKYFQYLQFAQDSFSDQFNINSCWSVQYSTAFSSVATDTYFYFWNWIFVCVHMPISPAATLLLTPLIYDSFVLTVLVLLHKMLFILILDGFHWNKHTQTLWERQRKMMFYIWQSP